MDSRTGTRAGRREWIGLAVLALPTLLLSIDVFVMLLALPTLSAELGASSTEQLWIMDMYGFMLSGFMITMGTLGDRVGRRRLLLVGATGFGVASVLAAYSVSPIMLIAARAVLGVAGATLAPSTLALISTMFRDARQRGLAIGVWMTCFMGGAAIGPVVGGALLEHFWWGSVFLLGVPAMLLLLVAGPALLPEYRNPAAGRLDLPSVALSLAAVLPIVYGLKQLAKDGWQPVPVAAVLFGAAVAVLFARRQRTLEHPLLNLRLFRSRAFSAALGGMLACTLLAGAVMLFIAQYLQLVRGLTPLAAGLWMLPGVVASGVSFLVSPLLARRIRPAYLIGGGLLLSTAGQLAVGQAGTGTRGLAVLVTGFALTNLGAGPLVTLGTALVVGSAPPEQAGSAASLNEVSGEFGFAVGIAALGSLGTAVYRAQMAGAAPDAPAAARDTLAGAIETAARLPQDAAAPLLAAARAAFADGLQVVATVSAVLLLAVAVLAVTMLRHVPPTGEPPAGEEAAGNEAVGREAGEPAPAGELAPAG